MRRRAEWAGVFVSVWLAGAAPADAAADDVPGREAWRSAVIERGLDPAEVVYPFAWSDEMAAWAARALEGSAGRDPVDALVELQGAIFDTTDAGFDYDDLRTLTAEQAFAQRRGHCLAFTSLFIALSRSVGIPTALLEVRTEPTVDRDDELIVVSRHVAAALRAGGQTFVFDFGQRSEVPRIGTRIIDDLHASAMFHANLGGEALRRDSIDEARRNLEIATRLAPEWPVGWVNLGVTLSRLGEVDGAFAAYRRALEVDPGNSSALNNLSYLFESLGRDAEASIALRAAAERTANPFTLIALADAELAAGDPKTAAKYLKRARRASPDEPEVFAALARLAERNGRHDLARRHLDKANRLRGRHDAGS